MARKIVISPACIGCGLCTVSPCIMELPDGTVAPKGSGILPKKEERAFMKIMQACPAKVISLEDLKVKSKNEINDYMNQTVQAFKLPNPSKQQLAFDEKYIVIPIPMYVDNEQTTLYSSYGRAKDAAKEAINQSMFSQRLTIIQNIINNYRIDKLGCYYEYKEVEGNFYYLANMRAQRILNDWIAEIQNFNSQIELPQEMLQIQTRPEIKGNFAIDIIKDYLISWAKGILSEMSGDCYKLSDYVSYCDIEDTEEYEVGLFGRDKIITKYYFKHTKAAFEEMARDIRHACLSSFDDRIIDNVVDGIVKGVIDEYTKKLKEELKSKIVELQKFI